MSRNTMQNDSKPRIWASADFPIHEPSRKSSDLFSKSKWSKPRNLEQEGRRSDQSSHSLPVLKGPNTRDPKSNLRLHPKPLPSFGLRHPNQSLWSKSRSLSDSHVWSDSGRQSPLDFESRVVWDGQSDPASNRKHNSFPGTKTTNIHPLLRNNKKKKKIHRWLGEMEKITKQSETKQDVNEVNQNDYQYRHLDLKRSSKYSLPEIKEERKPAYVSRYHADCYDSDDDLDGSWTLPRIEAVLISEGVQPVSIAQQIEKIKARKSKEYDNERRMKLKHYLEQKRLEESMHQREATILPGLVDNPESSSAKDAMDMYFKDIEKIRWIADQQIERGLLNPGVPIPRIVLVSSKYPDAMHLQSLVKDETVLPIFYDYHTDILSGLIREIKLRLRNYHEGYFMRSMLWCCQGGPGHLFFLKKTVISKQRIQGNKHPALAVFMKDIGMLMSKTEPSKAFVHILGCQWNEENAQETHSEFIEALDSSVSPNVVHFEAINENDEKGKDLIGLYFSYEKFIQLKEANRTH